MKKNFLFLVIFIFTGFTCFSQNTALTAKSLIDNAAKKTSLSESISYLKKNISSLSSNSEKRSAYAFLAAILEQQGQYSEAQKNYVQAASLQGSAVQTAAGGANKNSEQLVVDAVRCALSAGDYSSAETYLNSSVRNSKDEKILAFVKLYEQWADLCKAKNASDTKESIAMLKTYAALDSMKTVRSSIFLTLWHLTGENQYSESLKKNYPKSMEAAIVKGEIQTLPTPFWYFVPRNGVDLPEIAVVQNSEPSSKTEPKRSEEAKTSSKNDKIVKQQLGLFREEANAKALVQRLSEKGFKAEIATEVRPSGTKYYIVVVNENAKGTVGEELRTAGFECYPVFE
ncbi:SPOR domain-containing protein [Treponema sp.]|uniref:SPOR domain-containing protein n=1 Tax=Treponema sp. TaxID=166 RepID=UPI00388D93F7